MAIPLPQAPDVAFGQALNRGTNLFTQMMNRALEQKRLEEQKRQFGENKAWQREQWEALAPYRAAQLQNLQATMNLNPYRQQLLQQQILAAKHANDPMYEFNQFRNLASMMGGTPNQPMSQPMPNQEMGEGMGAFSPAGLQDAQSIADSAQGGQQAGGINLEMLKQNPMLRGFFKHKFGFDPLAEAPQTAEEKQQAALDLFRKKQEIKQAVIGDKVPLTGAMKTNLEKTIVGVDSALPVLQEVIQAYKQLPKGAETLSPAMYAVYNTKLNSIVDPLIAAYGLNVTDASADMVRKQVFRVTNEPLDKYRDRLVGFAKDLIRRRNDSYKNLKSGTVNPKDIFTDELFEGLKNETKIINGKKYTKINGEWHE